MLKFYHYWLCYFCSHRNMKMMHMKTKKLVFNADLLHLIYVVEFLIWYEIANIIWHFNFRIFAFRVEKCMISLTRVLFDSSQMKTYLFLFKVQKCGCKTRCAQGESTFRWCISANSEKNKSNMTRDKCLCFNF